ncbi:MAG: hypothetical protein RIB84_23895 [Sneathiellaceae bacterium]
MSEQERGRQQLVPMGGSYTLEERERHAARVAAGLPPLDEEAAPARPAAETPPWMGEDEALPAFPEISEDEAAAALAEPEQEDLE